MKAKRNPFAKALIKKSYAFGAPMKLLAAGYIPGLLIWLFTKWMWYFVPLGAIWHFWSYVKFKKDPLFFNYLFDALKEPGHLEP